MAKNVRDVSYEPEQFPGAIFKITNPKATLTIFKNGKMNCAGTNNKADLKKALDYAAKILAKYVLETH